MVWNFVLSLFLPTFHYSIIAFWQRILRLVVALWKLSLRDCLLLTLPVSTKLGPIDDFAYFSSKFWTHFYPYNGFVTFSKTPHNLLHKLVQTYCITFVLSHTITPTWQKCFIAEVSNLFCDMGQFQKKKKIVELSLTRYNMVPFSQFAGICSSI